VPRKAGHPKEIERIKSSQELALEQKVKSRRPQRWTQMVQQRQEELERRGGDGDNEGSEDKKKRKQLQQLDSPRRSEWNKK
jgi:hypothetical protein